MDGEWTGDVRSRWHEADEIGHRSSARQRSERIQYSFFSRSRFVDSTSVQLSSYQPIMAAKPLDSKAGLAEHREKRITSVGQLFGDDLKSSRSIKGLISACMQAIKQQQQ
jgi:hypothetical protein